MGYTLRKEKGSRRPLSKKKTDGYALYHNGNPVYPKFRNWWPNKKEATKALNRTKKELGSPHGRAHR